MYVPGRMESLLEELYAEGWEAAFQLLNGVLERRRPKLAAAGAKRGTSGSARLTERDAFLITYGDTLFGREGVAPLAALGSFARDRLVGIVSYIHILPFFPYSSDDGFSVMDYRTVNPELGSWSDVQALGADFRLAFDLVINHASAQGEWFKGFLRGDPRYSWWFLTRPEGYDSTSVVRPRTHPLLTPFTRGDGSRVKVWTTFSADQADLDFSNPAVLAEMVDIFLEYVERGARIIRMDAIAYLWKEDGHPCLHHPKTHAVVKLFRAVAESLDLDVLVLTETNVPHQENISYFGDGEEADMVYNFALPPLTLHAFTTGDVSELSSWAQSMRAPPGGCFLNFLASHDGIGLTPAKGLIEESAFRRTLDTLVSRGNLVSFKSTSSGPVPYELNASWFDAVSDPSLSEEIRVQAHLASHAVAACLDGMPAVYIHSLLGSGNWVEGPALKGYNRAINRRKIGLDVVETEIRDPESRVSRTLQGMRALYENRGREPALAPGTPTTVLSRSGPVFTVLRGEAGKRLLCAVNVSPVSVLFNIPVELKALGNPYDPTGNGGGFRLISPGALELKPFGALWMPVA